MLYLWPFLERGGLLGGAGRPRPAAGSGGRGLRAGGGARPTPLRWGHLAESCGRPPVSVRGWLGATPGTEITIEALGEDEAEALNALAELMTGRFGEEP